jgi:hypothetical protein
MEYLMDSWGYLGEVVDGRLKQNDIRTDIRNYVRELRAQSPESHTLVNVIIPETVNQHGWRHFLHNLHVQRLKAKLVSEADVVVTNVTHHAGSEHFEPVTALLPRQLVSEWHHVAVVLVAGAHNATARSLRYALSLQADDVRCIHVAVDEKESALAISDWESLGTHLPLEIVPSPYRQIARPIHSLVRAILEDRPRTFVTIVLPEFLVEKWWHRFLHNQTALTIKGTFLFEPSVVVSSVPYRL